MRDGMIEAGARKDLVRRGLISLRSSDTGDLSKLADAIAQDYKEGRLCPADFSLEVLRVFGLATGTLHHESPKDLAARFVSLGRFIQGLTFSRQ